MKSERARARISLILCLAMAVALVMFYRQQAGPGYPLDDSWIHLSYARTLASGDGFGATPHDSSPGATAPLWVVLLSVGFLFGLDHTVWPWLLGAACLGITGFLAIRLVLALTANTLPRPSTSWIALLSGLTVVTPAPLVWSAAGSMETPLFNTLVLASMLALTRSWTRDPANGTKAGSTTGSSRPWLPAVWGGWTGLAALVRPEGLLLAPLLAVLELSIRRPHRLERAALALLVCAVVYSPSVIFCLLTTGRVFPNTFYAKTTALVAGVPDLDFVAGLAPFFWRASPVALFAAIVGLGVLSFSLVRRQDVRPVLALAGFLVGLPLAYAAMGRTFLFAGFAGNFGRYLYPLIPPAVVLGAWAMTQLAVSLRRYRVEGVLLVLMLTGSLVSASGAVKHRRLFVHNVRDINTMQVAMAQSLSGRFPAGTFVAANDVGALSYFTDYRVLDLVGIVSTETLEALEGLSPGSPEREQALFDLLQRLRPVVLVVFPEWYADTLARCRGALQTLEVREDRQNITSGGSRLVAMQVDWNAVGSGEGASPGNERKP